LLRTSHEKDLAFKLLLFADVLVDIENEFVPQPLCEYLFHLSSQFHSFYEHCTVIGDEDESGRIKLCIATQNVLRTGAYLLGIKLLDRM